LAKKTKEDVKLEDALDMLENIISVLQDGNIPLDESLEKFENGIHLVRVCQEKLESAESKIMILLKDEKGSTKEAPFNIGMEE
jgi:exodeoxyribonuclease VII small subunit